MSMVNDFPTPGSNQFNLTRQPFCIITIIHYADKAKNPRRKCTKNDREFRSAAHPLFPKEID